MEKKAREKKTGNKVNSRENKKLKQPAKKKDKGSTKKSRGKQSPQKHLQRASGEKFQQNLKNWCVMKALIVRIVRILTTNVECTSLSTHLYMNPKHVVAR